MVCVGHRFKVEVVRRKHAADNNVLTECSENVLIECSEDALNTMDADAEDVDDI